MVVRAALRTLFIAGLHNGARLSVEYDDTTLRVKAVNLTAARGVASTATYKADSPVSRMLAKDGLAEGTISQAFDSSGFVVEIGKDGLVGVAGGKFRLN